MRPKLISLCMIVKDEEESLGRCLESVRGVVDEIIVVDTGSSDRTVAIAEQHAARVVSVPWQHDFSEARNAGIELADGEWILFLDADERLDQEGYKLRQYALQEQIAGLFLHIHNYVGNGSQGATINPVLRMFRNLPGCRFKGKIHEQIASQIIERVPDAAFLMTDVKIHHYGYIHRTVVKKGKTDRNLRLLLEAIKEQPDEPFHRYNIGVEYLRAGNAESALTSFQTAKEMIPSPEISYAHLIRKYEARCLQALGRLSSAIGSLREAIGIYEDYSDLYHYKASCHLALGQFDEAKEAIEQALRLGPAPAGYHTEDGIGSYQSLYMLGQLFEAENQYDRAVEAYVEAIRLKSDLNPPLYRLFHIYRVLGREECLADLFHERFVIRSSQSAIKMISILIECRCYEAALKLAQEKLPGSEHQAMTSTVHMLKMLSGGQIDEMKAFLEEREKTRGGETDFELRNFKAWLRWIENNEKPEEESLWEDADIVIPAAYASGNKYAASLFTEQWRHEAAGQHPDERKEASEAISRALITLADQHLASIGGRQHVQTLIRSARTLLPCKEGF
ncbi:glycosyltransferase [Paenibacillus sp. LHD-117]|uniref:tetratricopeptide repeat-containing glycosyltransferase family 2 protein n=1 Tax=Paenibacillus sp. LHD-117 TaxID=3071412 RepID=UPI0027DEADCA|nr:glycosyltransferase [Paenibacillus sp. LHD-117]MDQ6422463.1 glycosyltransferase [Paenibacillus sp. LHD-117]